MKKTLLILACSLSVLLAVEHDKIEWGKVYSTTKGHVHLQGLEKYYDNTLSKGISVQTSIMETLQTGTLTANIVTGRQEGKESFVGVMNNHTGEIVMLTRSSFLDFVTIGENEVPVVKDKFADVLFEPGRLMMPIWATVIAEQKANTSNLTSSLSAEVMRNGLNTFGFSIPSGIDLPYDEAGPVPSLSELKSEEGRLQLLEGKGLKVTFVQMLKAYSAFSAKGLLQTPHIASSTIEGNVTKKITYPSSRALSKKLSFKVKHGLINKAKARNDIRMMDFIEVGGVFGADDLYKEDNATDEAYSSYFGFAEDIHGQSYTIGVFLIYDKSKITRDVPSPMPIFDLVVERMVKEKLLYAKEEHLSRSAMSPMPTGEIVEYFSEQVERVPECLENNQRGISLECQYTTYKAPDDGAFVHTALDGKVTFVGSADNHGKVVIVRHNNKMDTMYTNLESIRSTIKKGVMLKKGYRIGRVNEILRFQLIKDGLRVDPLEYLEL